MKPTMFRYLLVPIIALVMSACATVQQTDFKRPIVREGATADAKNNYRLAVHYGRKANVPDHVTVYHVDRESGGNRYARNPTSTATGVSQVVYRTHIAITGEQMTKQQHFHRATEPVRSARIMAAHIAACRDRRPHWTPAQLHRLGYMAGLRNCGSSLEYAAQIYARISGIPRPQVTASYRRPYDTPQPIGPAMFPVVAAFGAVAH